MDVQDKKDIVLKALFDKDTIEGDPNKTPTISCEKAAKSMRITLEEMSKLAEELKDDKYIEMCLGQFHITSTGKNHVIENESRIRKAWQKYRNRRLENLRITKKPNWASDKTLHWTEKFFHIAAYIGGFFTLLIALWSLLHLAYIPIQRAETIVLAVVFMLLVVFGLFFVSGRGVEVIEHLRKKIEGAESIKLWGFTIKVPSSEKEKRESL